MSLSRRAAGFLLVVAGWSWVIWPTFIRNIAGDSRSFDRGKPTSFLIVHLVLTVVSLALGTGCGVLGWLALRRPSGARTTGTGAEPTHTPVR